MTTIDVLRGALARIEKGWCQGAYVSGESCCVLGAINRATSDADDDSAEYDEAVRAFKSANGISEGVARWNDAPGRTQAEVIAAFRAALASEEAKGGR